MLDTLPNELVRYIIHLSTSPSDPLCQPDLPSLSRSSRNDLASLALVHRSWIPFVEDELVRHVCIGSNGPYPSFVDLLRRRRKEKKTGVKSLVIDSHGTGGGEHESYENAELWRDVRVLRVMGGNRAAQTLLEHCRNVRLLILHGSTTDFHLSALPQVTKLVLMDTPRLEILRDVTPEHAPQLKRLVLDVNMCCLAGYFPPPPARPGRPGGRTVIPPGLFNPRPQPQPTAQQLVNPGAAAAANLPNMPLLPQLTHLTLRVHSLPYALPFLSAIVAFAFPPSGLHSHASLRHLRIDTSGAPEQWMALSPLLTVLDALETPLSSLHISYAHLEPLFYKLSRAPQTTPVPRCLSQLDHLTLSSFLGLSPTSSSTGVVERSLGADDQWTDLTSLRAYLAPLQNNAANGGKGVEVELRKVPKGIIEDEEAGERSWMCS
ncbi:hypothetical protein JCM10213_007778 [Rhodosporidiobolus nylandii]